MSYMPDFGQMLKSATNAIMYLGTWGAWEYGLSKIGVDMIKNAVEGAVVAPLASTIVGGTVTSLALTAANHGITKGLLDNFPSAALSHA